MVASSPASRSIMVNPAQGLPRVVDSFVGSLLELVIHSIEGIRERFKLTVG